MQVTIAVLFRERVGIDHDASSDIALLHAMSLSFKTCLEVKRRIPLQAFPGDPLFAFRNFSNVLCCASPALQLVYYEAL